MEMTDVIAIVGCCFAIISIIISLITIFFQIWVVNLRKFPGILVTMQCICQAFYDFH